MQTKNTYTLIFLVILPAMIIEISYLLFVDITHSIGLPNINALALSVLFIMLPLMLGIILFHSKEELGYKSIKDMISYNNAIGTKKFILYTLSLLSFGFLVFTLGKPLDHLLYEKFFTFIPTKYVLTISPENHTQPQLFITLFSSVFITGIAAPIVEEIYFRGFLLRRMERMGVFAPIINAVLFSFYHFWSPWQFITRIVFLIPFCYISYKTKNLKLTIVVHCLLNIFGDGLGILLMILN